MPTYDYVCDGCGHRFEEFQKFTDPHLKTCPACEKDSLRRLFGTGAAVLFKGSGFYETDYRSQSYKDSAKKDSEPSKSSSGDSKAGESKGDSGSAGSSGSTAGSGDGGAAKPAAAAG